MIHEPLLPNFLHDPVSRRTFLARMTAAGLGTAAAALFAGCGGSGGGSNGPAVGNGLTSFADQANFPNIPGQSENIVVLNYALTLETLEADLYRQALNVAAGKDIAAPLPADTSAYSLAVSPGALSGPQAAAGFKYLQQYAAVEAAHRDFLRAAIPQLGGTPVPANPKGYSAAAKGLAPGANLQSLLTVILLAEETGVTAYLGAAGFLTDPALVQVASAIYSTESRHSATINLALGIIDPGATGAPGPSGRFGGTQPVPGVLPGTAEFAQTPRPSAERGQAVFRAVSFLPRKACFNSMSDNQSFSGMPLATAGLVTAGLLAARAARAAAPNPANHVTFYVAAAPAGAPNPVQIPNTSTKFTTPSQDVQIVNFALAVETIEAERYRQTLARLTTGGTDMFGNPIAGLGLSASDLDVLLISGFGATEMQQRDFLATTLYGSPTANPFLANYRFDYGINSLDRAAAVTGIYTAETIGVGAYLGGAGLLSIKSPFLAPSASFLGVEARHAAGLAYALNTFGANIQTAPLATDAGVNPQAFGTDKPLTADQVLNTGGQVSPDLLPATSGVTPAISGPNGFVYLAA